MEISYPSTPRLNSGNLEAGLVDDTLNEFPSKESLEQRLQDMPIGSFSLRQIGDNGYILRTRDLTKEEHTAVLNALSLNGEKKSCKSDLIQ